jgi:hypothetical protein
MCTQTLACLHTLLERKTLDQHQKWRPQVSRQRAVRRSSFAFSCCVFWFSQMVTLSWLSGRAGLQDWLREAGRRRGRSWENSGLRWPPGPLSWAEGRRETGAAIRSPPAPNRGSGAAPPTARIWAMSGSEGVLWCHQVNSTDHAAVPLGPEHTALLVTRG